jgi:hypothetical protein
VRHRPQAALPRQRQLAVLEKVPDRPRPLLAPLRLLHNQHNRRTFPERRPSEVVLAIDILPRLARQLVQPAFHRRRVALRQRQTLDRQLADRRVRHLVRQHPDRRLVKPQMILTRVHVRKPDLRHLGLVQEEPEALVVAMIPANRRRPRFPALLHFHGILRARQNLQGLQTVDPHPRTRLHRAPNPLLLFQPAHELLANRPVNRLHLPLREHLHDPLRLAPARRLQHNRVAFLGQRKPLLPALLVKQRNPKTPRLERRPFTAVGRRARWRRRRRRIFAPTGAQQRQQREGSEMFHLPPILAPAASGQHLVHHIARHVRQPELPPHVLIRQPRVIKSHTMHDRRLQSWTCTLSSATLNPRSSDLPTTVPPLIPPPARNIEYASGW